MSQRTLKLSRDLSLPLDVAGEAIAILAKRGAGKTNTATVLVEELDAADVQTVVLDPVSAWWGLRSSADGEKAGLKFAVIGGAHGDVPLEEAAGELIADVVVDSGQSMVIDLSDFPSKKAMQHFVTDFAQRLYRRKAREQSLLHLVLEEADVFAPQSVRGGGKAGEQHAAIEQIVRRGRARGLGITMITQRSAVLNKDVLTQTDVLIVMRTTGPQDVKAIGEWVNAKGDEHGKAVLDSLPSLEDGEAWVWNPEHGVLARTQVRLRRTFDSSQTPRAGQRRAEPRQVAEINPAVLGEQIAATAERAKANDPRELRRTITSLERRLAEAEKAPNAVETIEVEKSVVGDEQLKLLRKVLDDAALLSEKLERREAESRSVVQSFRDALDDATAPIRAGLEKISGASAPLTAGGKREASGRPAAARRGEKPRPLRPEPPAAPRQAASEDGDLSISGPQQRILDALAALEQINVPVASKTQLALFAQASPKSSAYTNNLGRLNSQLGLIHYPRAGYAALTDAGRELADWHSAPTSNEELHAYVFGLVGNAKARLLQVLIDLYPNEIAKEELAERAGASPTSSAFTNNLGSLRSLGLITRPDEAERGYVAAKPVLFLEEAAVA